MQIRMRNVNQVQVFDLGSSTMLVFTRPEGKANFKLKYVNTDKNSKPICIKCGDVKNKKHKCGDFSFYDEDELKEFMLARFNSNPMSVLVVNGLKLQHKMV